MLRRGTLGRASRGLALGRALVARRLSFFANLRDKVSDELAKNPALQQSLKELREQTRGAAAAGDAAAGASAQASATPDADGARAPRGGATGGAAAAGGKAEAGAGGGGGATPPRSAFDWLRALLSEAAAPPATATPERAPGADDTSTTSVVVKPPSAWEQAFNRANDSPLLGGVLGLARGLFGGLGAGASTIGDKVFGENESTEALARLKERDDAFSPGPLVSHCERVVIPSLIAAYLAGDLAKLKERCVDAAYASLHSNVRTRMAQQLFMDRRVLDISSIELQGFRLVGEEPTAVLSFQTQQVNCVRDAKGKVVEGAEDDIRAVYYIMALQQQLPPAQEGDDVTEERVDTRPSVERWVVTEIAVRGAMETW